MVIRLPKWDDHAEKRKKRYGITEKQIAETWVYGEVLPGEKGRWRLVGKKITLVTNPAGDFIVTMYPNKHHDRHTGERIARAMSVGATRFEED